MPKPSAGESEQDFVSRCIPIVLKDGTAKDQQQASAICFSIYRERDKEHSPLSVIKQKDGTYRWVLLSSNSFEDRDQEIVSQKALERDVERADADKEYGPLRWWHVKGLDIGDCDFNMVYGRVLVESGTFRDWRYGEAVERRAKELGASIGFHHPASEPDAEGVFYNIRRYERSLLPRAFASNPFTSVQLVKESAMPTQADKVKAFAEFMQVDEAVGLKMLQAAEQAEQAAVAANARTKAKMEGKEDDKPDEEDKPNGTDAEADKPFKKDEAEDDAEPTMKKKEFDATMQAVVGELERVKAELHILQTAQAEKAQRETDLNAALTTAKETADKAWQLAQELNGTLPRKLGDPLAQYRPSQNGKEPTADKVKSVTDLTAPPNDPWAKHMNALMPQPQAPRPPGM